MEKTFKDLLGKLGDLSSLLTGKSKITKDDEAAWTAFQKEMAVLKPEIVASETVTMTQANFTKALRYAFLKGRKSLPPKP
jgi:hypothetical protein